MARIKVRVKDRGEKKFGFYDNKRRYAGEMFFIDNEKQFSKRWMEKCDGTEKPVKEEKVRKITGDPKTKVHTTGPHAGAITRMVDGVPVGDASSQEVI